MTSSHPLPVPCQWFSQLASALDCRSAPRLARLFLGAVLARGRRTITTWIRAGKLSGRYQSCYLAVGAASKKADGVARRLLLDVVRPLLEGATRLPLALDWRFPRFDASEIILPSERAVRGTAAP